MTVIDISRYQGTVDFNAVKAAGVSLVIAKMGGGDSGQYVDSKWTQNLAGIRAAGIPLGSYYFNGPASSPAAAADFQFAHIDWHPGDLVVADVEGSGIAWSPGQVLEWATRMLAHGVPAGSVGVYMSASPEHSHDWSAVAALGVFLWVASYGANTGQPGTPPTPAHWHSWSLWQYTSNGSVPGIAGRVDMSQIAPGWAATTITPLNNPKPKDEDMSYSYISRPTGPGGKTQWALLGVEFPDGAIVTQDINVANGFAAFDRNGTVTDDAHWQPTLNQAKINSDMWKAAVASVGGVGGPVTVNAQVSVLPELVTALKDPTVQAALSAAIKVPTKIEATLS